jgi:hypothetical protein
MLTLGSKSTFGQSVSPESINQDTMTGEDKMNAKPKAKLLGGRSLLSKVKKMGGAGSSSDKH